MQSVWALHKLTAHMWGLFLMLGAGAAGAGLRAALVACCLRTAFLSSGLAGCLLRARHLPSPIVSRPFLLRRHSLLLCATPMYHMMVIVHAGWPGASSLA